jgi:hypothetical protein
VCSKDDKECTSCSGWKFLFVVRQILYPVGEISTINHYNIKIFHIYPV